MPALSNSRREAFAQARFNGMGVMEAYRAAGYAGQCPKVASGISQHPEVKARIMELHNAAATVVAYERMDAIRDLVTIIKARPSEASAEHPLCEVRTGRQGQYHRFPSKLRALARLVKILGWEEAPKLDDEEEAKPDPIRELLIRIRAGGHDADTLHGCDAAERAEEAASASATPDMPLTPRQEAFAQARFAGMGVQQAYEVAGYTGDPSRRAWRVSQHPAVKARLAQLRKAAEDALPYKRHEAINDLIAIVQASPSEAGPENPLCEMRMGQEGPYYRFPCKLAAMMQLVRLMRWHEPEKVEMPPGLIQDDPVERMLERIRSRP